MSLRIDSTEWISGALIIGETGLGVIGSAIPSTGDHGAGYAYNDLSLPADNAKEICGRITTWPTLGTLTAFEDTSILFEGPDGSHSFQYQLYVDGVATGSPTTVSLTVGDVSSSAFSVASGSTFSGSASISPLTAFSVSSETSFSGSAGVGSTSSFSVASGSAFSGGAYVSPLAAFSVGSESAFSGSASAGVTASFSVSSESSFSGSAYVSPLSIFAVASGSAFAGSASAGVTAAFSVSTGSAFSGSATGYVASGTTLSPEDIAAITASIMAALNATTIPVNTMLMNSAPVIGDGSELDRWRGFGVPN